MENDGPLIVEVKGFVQLASVWYLISFLSILFIILGHREYVVDHNLIKYLGLFIPTIVFFIMGLHENLKYLYVDMDKIKYRRMFITNGIINGYQAANAGKFGPNDNIQRQQLAVILNKYAKYKGKDISASSNLEGFEDAEKISSYAISQVKWAVGAGIITGSIDKSKGKKYINPKGNATRAEVAAMLQKYCTKVGR